MASDFDEFVTRLGRDVPTFRNCLDCGDTMIVNPETYDKPKTVCDPGYCEHAVPFCICKDTVLFSERGVERCRFPDCPQVARETDDE